ncbi:hypothetical protein TNIN_386801 [Trichonephila inaurata madagascariensis]|uniref:Uncharacterized protein n=1 Tax=Trichonephila inaurata madagascariensis TaxID=2747483 RepID=A0A8X6XAB5_9ARAC|nr:hypothetical protein TNIN_386801 [Trichonephila inaurata madagascariensis]
MRPTPTVSTQSGLVAFYPPTACANPDSGSNLMIIPLVLARSGTPFSSFGGGHSTTLIQFVHRHWGLHSPPSLVLGICGCVFLLVFASKLGSDAAVS